MLRLVPPWATRRRSYGGSGRGALALVLALTCLASTAPVADVAHGQAEPAPRVHGHLLSHRWVYLPNNFQAQGNVERVSALLDRAKAAGYNGALLADVKFGRLDDGSLVPAYYTNLQAVLRHARDLGMEVVPGTADFGYSEGILWHDPDLAEGLPVRGATFRVEGGQLVPFEAEPVVLVNGDFEQLPTAGHQLPGWAWLAELEGVPGIEGVMYTAWSTGYDNLEAWARHVWGDAPWITTLHLPIAARCR